MKQVLCVETTRNNPKRSPENDALVKQLMDEDRIEMCRCPGGVCARAIDENDRKARYDTAVLGQ